MTRIEARKKIIIEDLFKIKRNGMENLISWLCKTDFFSAPASAKYHGDYEGGLAEHSHKVMKVYSKLNEIFKRGIQEESIIIGGLLHDVCKANFYTTELRNRKVAGKWESYNAYTIEDQEPLGHGSKSVIIINRYIKLTELEEYSILHHMGLPKDYMDICSYNNAVEKIPDILWLHIADNISSNIFEMSSKQKEKSEAY